MSDALKAKDTPAGEIKKFEEGVTPYYKNRILPDFDGYEFYTGASSNQGAGGM